MGSLAELRYSDIATYVHLSLQHRGTRQRAPAQKVSSSASVPVLAPRSPGAASSAAKQPTREKTPTRQGGEQLPPIAASQAERLKSHLSLLQAEQHIQQEQVRKLAVSLSDSKLAEKKARQRTAKHRELHNHHRQRCSGIDKEIARLRHEISAIESGVDPRDVPPLAGGSHGAEPPSSEPRGTKISWAGATGMEGVVSPAEDGGTAASAASSAVASPAGAAPPGGAARELPAAVSGEEERSAVSWNIQDGAAAAAPAEKPSAEEEEEEAQHSGTESEHSGSDKGEDDSDADEDDEDDEDDDEETLVLTQRVEEPAEQGGGTSDAIANPAATIKFTDVKPRKEPSSDDESADLLAEFLRGRLGKNESQLPKEQRLELTKLRREVIREEMIGKAGTARQAFRALDLNGSGSISHQEFADGVRRLGVDWSGLTGLKTERDFFKLFDADRDHVILFRELFPKQAAEERAGMTRVPTPVFCKRYRLEKTQEHRLAGWQPKNPEEKLTILTKASDSADDAAHKRKWIRSTMRRLKGKGKSDARCREMVALHLPKGSGPRDLQGVNTFSQADLRKVRQDYSDEWNQPIRDTTRTMVNLRELRREQKQIIERLYKVTEAEYARQRAEEKAATGLGMALFGDLKGPGANGAAKPGGPAAAGLAAELSGSASKTVEQLSKELRIQEAQLESIHTEFIRCTENNGRMNFKGFSRLLKVIAPSRTLADSDVTAWWLQIFIRISTPKEIEAMRLQLEGGQDGAAPVPRGAQPQCDFEQFATWYASCELRVQPPPKTASKD